MILECNRTYYGNLQTTNYLELPRLRDDRLPFICELNFTAAGGIHGDIIQVEEYIISDGSRIFEFE